jgi:hypothetical protein
MSSLLRSKRKSHTGHYIAAGVIGAAVIGVVAAVYHARSTRTPEPDAQTLCPASGPLGHIVVLVDRSDPMNFTQRKAFSVAYRELVTQVPRGHLLSLYALGDDFKSTAEPLVEVCHPGDGSDVKEFDDNPAKRRRAYEQKYLKPLLDREEELVTQTPGKASPILEMIQLAGITGFRKHRVAGDKRLVIVSDMIQHTPQMSMYRAVPDYAGFSQTPYGVKSRGDLQDVKVEFRMLMNTPAIQNERLLDFWKSYIRQSGGRLVLHDPING